MDKRCKSSYVSISDERSIIRRGLQELSAVFFFKRQLTVNETAFESISSNRMLRAIKYFQSHDFLESCKFI